MRNDQSFIEMMIHHTVSLVGISFGYFANFENYVAYPMLMSNICDIIFNLTRFGRDVGLYKNPFVGYFFYLVLLISWLVSRVIIMPTCFYAGAAKAFEADPIPDYRDVW